MNNGEQKSIQQISVDTQLIYERLTQSQIGELIPYVELNKLIGRDVQTSARSNLMSARHKAETSNRMVFGVVWNEGLKRLDDVGIVGTGRMAIDRVRRVARRGVKTLMCVKDFDAMPNGQRVAHNMAVSLLGVTAMMTKPTSIKRLENRTAEEQRKLSTQKTLDFFKA